MVVTFVAAVISPKARKRDTLTLGKSSIAVSMGMRIAPRNPCAESRRRAQLTPDHAPFAAKKCALWRTLLHRQARYRSFRKIFPQSTPAAAGP